MVIASTGSILKKYEYSDYGERNLDSKTENLDNEFGYNGEAHARNQQSAFTGSLTLLGSTNKAPTKDTVVPKEETNATGEQESGNTCTVTTIVAEQQGSSETQQTELSASTQFNIISTGLVLRDNQIKKVMLLMLLLMIISSSERLIDDSLDSLKEQYDKWSEYSSQIEPLRPLVRAT